MSVKNLETLCIVRKVGIGKKVKGVALSLEINSIKITNKKWSGLATTADRAGTCTILFDGRKTICYLLNIPEVIGEQIESMAGTRQLFYRHFPEGPLPNDPIEQKLFYWLVSTRPRNSLIVSGVRCKNVRPKRQNEPMVLATSVERVCPKTIKEFENVV